MVTKVKNTDIQQIENSPTAPKLQAPMVQPSVTPVDLESYLANTVKTQKETTTLIERLTGKNIQELTDADIQFLLYTHAYAPHIRSTILFNVVANIMWEKRKIEFIKRLFHKYNIELDLDRVEEESAEYAYNIRFTDEDREKLKDRLERPTLTLTPKPTMIPSLEYIAGLQYTRDHEHQHLLQLQREYQEQLRLVLKLVVEHRMTMNHVKIPELVLTPAHQKALYDFHHNYNTEQRAAYIDQVYPHNAHLTAEDIRNLLFHPEMMKMLERFQDQREGYELRLNTKINEMTHVRGRLNALDQQLTHQHKQQNQLSEQQQHQLKQEEEQRVAIESRNNEIDPEALSEALAAS